MVGRSGRRPSVSSHPKSDSARTAGWRRGRSSHPAGQPLYPRTGAPGRIRCLDPGPEPASGRSVLDWNRAARRRSCLVDTTHVRERLRDWCRDLLVPEVGGSGGAAPGRVCWPFTVLTDRLEIRRLRPRGVDRLLWLRHWNWQLEPVLAASLRPASARTAEVVYTVPVRIRPDRPGSGQPSLPHCGRGAMRTISAEGAASRWVCWHQPASARRSTAGGRSRQQPTTARRR